MKIGEILRQKYSLTAEQLDEGLKIQGEKGGKIGEILIRLNYIKEDELLEALSIQLSIPYLGDIQVSRIQKDLLVNVPITFAKRYTLIPIQRDDDKILVAVSNPMNISAIDDLRLILKENIKVGISSSRSILNSINLVYDRLSDTAEQVIEDMSEENLYQIASELHEPEDLLEVTDEAPIIRLINSLLFQAVKDRASDIHFEPFERELLVRYRIDGILYNIITSPKRMQSSIISRIKVMAGLNIAEKRLPQDGRIGIKIAGKEVDIRVSVIPTAHGERVVLRLLDKSMGLLNLEDIGLSDRQFDTISRLIEMKHGFILVTGPTGSGKTTTLYASLSRINSPDKNIITIEDPIEYQLKGIGQMHVNPKINLTFANGLRSILRQDPDVIMVGEIRDTETAEIAIHASLTGHLVFSTLHTNDSAGAITRLIDMGIEPFLVSSSVIAIIAQRLVRTICDSCKQEYLPQQKEIQKLGLGNLYQESGDRSQESEVLKKKGSDNMVFYKGAGCDQCMGTGYKGRHGIYEILLIDDEMRELILARSDSNTIKNKTVENGMTTLRQEGAIKVINGITTTEETLRVTQEEI
ncbi:MAG: type II secretion system ATPase GspE [Nitrospirota bacterium]